MRKILMMVLLLSIPVAQASAGSAYILNSGDELVISVWKEEDLKERVVILPDGSVTFPLAGQVQAAGRTVRNVQNDIAKRLKRFVPDALVTISVVNALGNKIYIMGEVNKPGEYQLARPLDVMQALSVAGGLSPYASQDRITILRREGEREVALPFPYSEVASGQNLGANIKLKSGDTIVVPGRSLF